jgi:hypothetical protein
MKSIKTEDTQSSTTTTGETPTTTDCTNLSSSYEDDSSIESSNMKEDSTKDQEVHAVSVSTGKHQKPSDIRYYKEINSYKRWFDSHVRGNGGNSGDDNNSSNKKTSNIVCATSPVAELCGVKLKIYYRKNYDDESQQRRKQDRKRVNKIATMLSFDPNTGLYNALVRGKAYIIQDDGATKLSKRAVWTIQELIAEHKGMYHEYGADFSRQGQIQLLRACVQYKKGKWVPRSVYDMALTKTDVGEMKGRRHPCHGSCLLGSINENENHNAEIQVDETLRRSSSSRWFLTSYPIHDILQE